MHSEGGEKATGAYQVTLWCILWSGQPCPVLLAGWLPPELSGGKQGAPG